MLIELLINEDSAENWKIDHVQNFSVHEQQAAEQLF